MSTSRGNRSNVSSAPDAASVGSQESARQGNVARDAVIAPQTPSLARSLWYNWESWVPAAPIFVCILKH